MTSGPGCGPRRPTRCGSWPGSGSSASSVARTRARPCEADALGHDGAAVAAAPRHTRGGRRRRGHRPRPGLGAAGDRGGARARVRHRARRRPRRQRRAALPPTAPLPAGRGQVAAYVARYALREEDLPGDDPDTVRLRRRAVGRVPDARRLAADLLAHRGQRREAHLTSREADRPGGRAAEGRRRRQRLPARVGRGRERARPVVAERVAAEPAGALLRRPGRPARWSGRARLGGVPRRPAGLARLQRGRAAVARCAGQAGRADEPGAHDAARAGLVRRHARRPLLGDRGRHRPLRRSRHRPDGAGADAARRVRADLRQRLVRGADRPAGRLRDRDRLLPGDRLLRRRRPT